MSHTIAANGESRRHGDRVGKRFDVSVNLCTYKRPESLAETLGSLVEQTTSASFEIVVVDNDAEGSGEPIVLSFKERASVRNIELTYDIEPEQNIALARNRAFNLSRGEMIAFIDDDEISNPRWLEQMMLLKNELGCDGVFGPAYPIFRKGFPVWLSKSRIFNRKRHKTARRVAGHTCATGNGLVNASLLRKRKGPFDPAIARIGGSDVELFGWLEEQGGRFHWCAEELVFEYQEERQRSLLWHIKRGYRVGWGYARLMERRHGRRGGALRVLLNTTLATGKITALTVLDLGNPLGALYFFSHRMARQAGKAGYHLGLSFEEYGREYNRAQK